MAQVIASKSVLKYHSMPLLKQEGISHGFFTRKGGASLGPIYGSLNCNINSEDKYDHVQKNLSLVSESLGFDVNNLKMLNQVHSKEVVIIEKESQSTLHLKADALVTNRTNILLGIKTADCIPILFFEPKSKVIGAAHAGWKGAFGGVIEATIDAMKNLGAKISEVIVSIGPCIQQKSFEVDENFYAIFLREAGENKRFFINSNRKDHYMFDLPAYCINMLKDIGVITIDNLQIDTYSNPENLFSFRRATHENLNPDIKPQYGTQLSVIGIR